MFPPVNLSPIEELLTSITSPESLAQVMEDIAFDYARTTLELYLLDLDETTFIHPKSAHFIWVLRQLRDVFRACEIKQ